jgi:hypothetical protein
MLCGVHVGVWEDELGVSEIGIHSAVCFQMQAFWSLMGLKSLRRP